MSAATNRPAQAGTSSTDREAYSTGDRENLSRSETPARESGQGELQGRTDDVAGLPEAEEVRMSYEIVPRATNDEKKAKPEPAKCGRCNQPKHKGGCRGVTKARHSRAWKATR